MCQVFDKLRGIVAHVMEIRIMEQEPMAGH
jgi:hypothetical protein